jgi:hypothetical protein
MKAAFSVVSILFNSNVIVFWSQSSIVTTLWTGCSGVRIPIGARDFTLLQNIQTGQGAHLVFYSVGIGVLSWH